MQIDQLQIELRPRTNAQALDLGFALLRSHASEAYKAYLALWLPLLAVALLLAWRWPALTLLWALGLWWLKPLLERAPLYVLSRQVFGTSVTWRDAVRAWPRQLGGGWFALLTWARLLSAGRGLHQPVWQLEMARGTVARVRRRVLGRQGTFGSAFWFGIVCFQLEMVILFGTLAFVGMFVAGDEIGNPFTVIATLLRDDPTGLVALMVLAMYGAATAILAPVYTAGCFTLYLNRRARLEAWDLELQLRQIVAPAAARARAPASVAAMLGAVLLAASFGAAPDAQAAKPAAAPTARCAPPETSVRSRTPDQTPQQARLRREVDAIYAGPDLRGYDCVQGWYLKKPQDKQNKKIDLHPWNLDWLAVIMKIIVIAAGLCLVAWLLYRYRDRLPSLRRHKLHATATEVGGLDIRAESLPADVTAAVRALWADGQRRAALALLYRATLSRLVTEDGLAVTQGFTEGDCLRLAQRAAREQRLAQARLDVAQATTGMWLDGAYAARWPDTATVHQRCDQWQAGFGQSAASA